MFVKTRNVLEIRIATLSYSESKPGRVCISPWVWMDYSEIHNGGIKGPEKIIKNLKEVMREYGQNTA